MYFFVHVTISLPMYVIQKYDSIVLSNNSIFLSRKHIILLLNFLRTSNGVFSVVLFVSKYNKKRKTHSIKNDMRMYSSFSVSIVKLRPFIGVVGILHIVQLNANKNIGIENTKGCAEEKGDFLKPMLLSSSSKTKFAFGTHDIIEKINKTSKLLAPPHLHNFIMYIFLVIIFRLLLNVCLA